jgi:hypothetical protein
MVAGVRIGRKVKAGKVKREARARKVRLEKMGVTG